MEHNVYVFPPFVLVGPLLRYFFDQRQCFAFTVIVPRLQRHRYRWAILQPIAVDSFLLGRKGDPAVLLFPSRTCPDFIATILDKSPWDSTAIFIFYVISRFPLKTVQRFRNFLAVRPPPTLYKVETRKKILDTRVQHCLWGEGRGWTCVNWKTQRVVRENLSVDSSFDAFIYCENAIFSSLVTVLTLKWRERRTR